MSNSSAPRLLCALAGFRPAASTAPNCAVARPSSAPPRPMDISKTDPALGKIRPKQERVPKCLHGLAGLPALSQHVAEAAVKGRDVALQPDRLADQLQTDLGAAGSRRELSDHMQAFDMPRIEL